MEETDNSLVIEIKASGCQPTSSNSSGGSGSGGGGGDNLARSYGDKHNISSRNTFHYHVKRKT